MNKTLPKVGIVGISLARGGAERSIAILSQLLHNFGYDVHLIILTNKIEYEFSGQLYNLGVEKDKSNKAISRFKRFKSLRSYLKKEAIDVVIDQRPKNNYLRELFYAKYLYKGIARIYVVQNSKAEKYFASPVSKMLSIYKSNFANVGVSQYIYEHLLLGQGIKNATYIPNTYLENYKSNTSALPAEISRLDDFILFYGRIDNEHKDLIFLLNAYENSDLHKHKIPLVIMGDGQDKEKIITYAKQLSCYSSLIFLGFNKHPFTVVKKARAVAITSKFEGFPLVIIETLSVGTPVVSLDFISGPSEVIQNKKNGLLIKNRSVKDFALALNEICFNEDLYQCCKKNASSSVEEYSEKAVAKKWHSLLQDFLN